VIGFFKSKIFGKGHRIRFENIRFVVGILPKEFWELEKFTYEFDVVSICDVFPFELVVSLFTFKPNNGWSFYLRLHVSI